MASRRPVAVHIGIGWVSIYNAYNPQCSLANVILKTALSPIELSVLGHRISANSIGSAVEVLVRFAPLEIEVEMPRQSLTDVD